MAAVHLPHGNPPRSSPRLLLSLPSEKSQHLPATRDTGSSSRSERTARMPSGFWFRFRYDAIGPPERPAADDGTSGAGVHLEGEAEAGRRGRGDLESRHIDCFPDE